uniref:Uncharacterized protein n=1 Tax=Tanacetum cinerariifolium TaxID=118510 RepID=A0A699JF01_TANCI|nr:hypothetical protein [Tanacetum cinerariifolium]
MDVEIVVDDELLHKLVSIVEKNELVEELLIDVVDTEQNVTEFNATYDSAMSHTLTCLASEDGSQHRQLSRVQLR